MHYLEPRVRSWDTYKKELEKWKKDVDELEKCLQPKREIIDISLPPQFFSLNSLEKLVDCFEVLGINDSYLSSPFIEDICVEARGEILPQNRNFIQYLVGNQVLHSQLGEQFYFDITTTPQGVLRQRDKIFEFRKSNEENKSLYEDFMHQCFEQKLEQSGLIVEGTTAYGFEEMELFSKGKYEDMKNYLNDFNTRKLYQTWDYPFR